MGKREDRYTLEGMIEMDEGYFTVASNKVEKGNTKRGKGSTAKQNVMVSAESTLIEDTKTKKKRSMYDFTKQKCSIVINQHQSMSK